jgi:hypothetical protein
MYASASISAASAQASALFKVRRRSNNHYIFAVKQTITIYQLPVANLKNNSCSAI